MNRSAIFSCAVIAIVKVPRASEIDLNILSKVVSKLEMLDPTRISSLEACVVEGEAGVWLMSGGQLYIRDASEVSLRIRQRLSV